MTSLRSTVTIEASADDVWAVVASSDELPSWFASVDSCSVEGDMRLCTLKRGGRVLERVVNVDDALRRFQYSVVEGLPVSNHLGTIDVIETGARQCLVVYSTEAEPDPVAVGISQAVAGALADLKVLVEQRVGSAPRQPADQTG
jgi:uncharacterized membrane protein